MYKYKIDKYRHKLFKKNTYSNQNVYRQKLKYYKNLQRQQGGTNGIVGIRGPGIRGLQPPPPQPPPETEEQRRIRERQEENRRKQHLRDTIWNSDKFNTNNDKFQKMRKDIIALEFEYNPYAQYKYKFLSYVVNGLVRINKSQLDDIIKYIIIQATEHNNLYKKFKDLKLSTEDIRYYNKKLSQEIEVQPKFSIDSTDIHLKIIIDENKDRDDRINEIIITRDNQLGVNTVDEIVNIDNHVNWIQNMRAIGEQIYREAEMYKNFMNKIDGIEI